MSVSVSRPLASPYVDSFPESAPAANPVFFRTYSRRRPDGRENWQQVVDRNLQGLHHLGRLTQEQTRLLGEQQLALRALPSGRWLWVGGTPWLDKPFNFSGAYNCTSTEISDIRSFKLLMSLAMQGSGTGAVLEYKNINKLPPVKRKLTIADVSDIGTAWPNPEGYYTKIIPGSRNGKYHCIIRVGDSRQGWCEAYEALLILATGAHIPANLPQDEVIISVDLSAVRPAGVPLTGFGGVANPIKLPELFPRVAAITNRAVGRKLTSLECCLLIDEAALVVVAGNVRRSAGMRQFSYSDIEAADAKANLWQQDASGAWHIDPERDALRMANHTRVAHRKPSLEEIHEAVTKQFASGEGAIQYAPEALYRANIDILWEHREEFLNLYTTQGCEATKRWLRKLYPEMLDQELDHRMQRYGLNPCGEIIGADFHCNLAEVHLNLIDPTDHLAQENAFRAAALSVASLLHHEFVEPRYAYSRNIDPIVGVSFTGLFDFFVQAFGTSWLHWWAAGRPLDAPEAEHFRLAEASYLVRWRRIVEDTVAAYCREHNLRCPNRCTTVQPAGTKSLLTGASSGWHPPKAQRFIRRITFGKNDPVALACMDYGYTVVPAQSDKDEQGRLLDDPFDPRCTEWLVEIPTEVSWANLPGADEVDIANFSAAAQFDFYMQVQRHYTTHNTSATIEFRESEIDELASLIYESIANDEGYISAALLARFDDNEVFPRMPFEPISAERYAELHAAVLERRKSDCFEDRLHQYDAAPQVATPEPAGPAGCDSDKCLLPLAQPGGEK